jgi:hypothetical protein
MSINWPKNGPNNVPSYQISGLPFVTSSIADELVGSSANVVRVQFPYITSAIAVTGVSTSAGVIRMGFTENGVKGQETHNYITIPVVANRPITTPQFNIRCKEIFLMAESSYDAGFSVYAELTGISTNLLPALTGSLDPVIKSDQIQWEGLG